MRFFRRGQHQPFTRRPIPPDNTSPIPRIRTGLLQPPGTTLTSPPQPRMLPAPPPPMPSGWVPGVITKALNSPSSVPPLRPAPPRRQAWVPAQRPAPPPPPRITEPAALACPGGRIPAVLTLPCGSCHRVHTRGATSSFQVLRAEAAHAGWRTDLFGTWACPACQETPGWYAPYPPAVVWGAEHALIRDVAASRAPRWRWRKALRTARLHLDTRALRALRP